MGRQQVLRLRYRDVTLEDAPAAPHPDVVHGFERLGYRRIGLVRGDVEPGGPDALAKDYGPEERAALLEHLPEPLTILVSGDGRTFVQVGWFWTWPGVVLVSLTDRGARVETHWRWDAVPPWPAKVARARRFATVDGELHRSAARRRSVTAVPDADPARLHEAHRAHLAAYVEAHGDAAVELPKTVTDLLPLLERAYKHAQAVSGRGAAVVRALQQVLVVAAAVIAWGLVFAAHPVASLVWLLAAPFLLSRLLTPVWVRTFYMRWWRPAYR